MPDLRILFISRKHPPSVGGMEHLSYHLIQGVRQRADVQVQAIVWRHSQWFLPWFGLSALLQGVRACRRGVDVIHIGDPVLSLLGLILKKLFQVPIAITVHGLDMTFSLKLYQAFVPGWVKRYDKVICISRLAYEVSIERGVPKDRCVIIRPGTEMPRISSTRAESREVLAQRAGRNWDGAKLLLTVGRLVPRKGVFFFVDQVMPQLVDFDSTFVYVVVGTGPELERIQKAVDVHGLQEHVCLTGYLPSNLLWHAYNACELFLAPNVLQPHDVEGFGLIVLEAAAMGCPVLVSDIEGLRDTIPVEAGGCFVRVGDANDWFQQVRGLFENPAQLLARGLTVQAYVAQRCTWPMMAEAYIDEFRRLIGND